MAPSLSNLRPLFFAVMVFVTGCATIFRGPSASLTVESGENSENARILIDGRPVASVPAVLELDRGKEHLLVVEKPGFHSESYLIKQSFSGRWFLLDWILPIPGYSIVVNGPVAAKKKAYRDLDPPVIEVVLNSDESAGENGD